MEGKVLLADPTGPGEILGLREDAQWRDIRDARMPTDTLLGVLPNWHRVTIYLLFT